MSGTVFRSFVSKTFLTTLFLLRGRGLQVAEGDPERWARRENDRAFDAILYLPDIART